MYSIHTHKASGKSSGVAIIVVAKTTHTHTSVTGPERPNPTYLWARPANNFRQSLFPALLAPVVPSRKPPRRNNCTRANIVLHHSRVPRRLYPAVLCLRTTRPGPREILLRAIPDTPRVLNENLICDVAEWGQERTTACTRQYACVFYRVRIVQLRMYK